jgi:hypothetical protein
MSHRFDTRAQHRTIATAATWPAVAIANILPMQTDAQPLVSVHNKELCVICEGAFSHIYYDAW